VSSLDELRDDLKRNVAEARTLTTIDQVIGHINNTMWPFVEVVLDVVEEQDGSIRELVDHEEDYLQPETAAVFAAVVQSSLQLAAELRQRAGADAMIAQLVSNHELLCEQAVMVLGQVTMVPDDDDEDDEDGGSDEAQADETDDGVSHE
jgi:hypothetical protein